MRILLVEDDECTRKMLTAVLKGVDSDLDIEVAANGDDALKRYLERSYHDLVINRRWSSRRVWNRVDRVNPCEKSVATHHSPDGELRRAHQRPSNKSTGPFLCWKSRTLRGSFRTW